MSWSEESENYFAFIFVMLTLVWNC